MDTLAVTNKLVANGVPEAHAKAQVEALQEATKDFATKAQVEALKAQVEALQEASKEFAIKAQVEALQEASKEFATKADMQSLEESLRKDMVTKADFHKEMTVLAWRVITALLGVTAIFGGIVAVVAKLFLG